MLYSAVVRFPSIDVRLNRVVSVFVWFLNTFKCIIYFAHISRHH